MGYDSFHLTRIANDVRIIVDEIPLVFLLHAVRVPVLVHLCVQVFRQHPDQLRLCRAETVFLHERQLLHANQLILDRDPRQVPGKTLVRQRRYLSQKENIFIQAVFIVLCCRVIDIFDQPPCLPVLVQHQKLVFPKVPDRPCAVPFAIFPGQSRLHNLACALDPQVSVGKIFHVIASIRLCFIIRIHKGRMRFIIPLLFLIVPEHDHRDISHQMRFLWVLRHRRIVFYTIFPLEMVNKRIIIHIRILTQQRIVNVVIFPDMNRRLQKLIQR